MIMEYAINPDQIIEKWPELVTDDERYLIFLTEIRKEDQTIGGWRWHKWGEYIGTQEPQHEYLYDEPNIQSIYVFQICRIMKDLTKLDDKQ